MGDIICNGVTLPGNRITVPVFCGNGSGGASFTPHNNVATMDSIYSFASKIYKGTPDNYTRPYIIGIEKSFVRKAYNNTVSTVGGSSLLYRRKVKIYYGFVAGKGGNGGNGSQNWASWDRGSGGGGGGCALFWLIAPYETNVSISLGYASMSIIVDGISHNIIGGDGGNGGGKYSAGGGGSASYYRDGNKIGEVGAGSSDYWTYDGTNYYFICLIQGGQTGGEGQGWNGQTTPGDYSLGQGSLVKSLLGSSSDLYWTRNDGQGGACIAPGVNENGGTTWYGSGGHSGDGGNGGRTDGQGAGARYWSYTVEV